eukprot:c19134_g3_i1 orf=569-772(+)
MHTLKSKEKQRESNTQGSEQDPPQNLTTMRVSQLCPQPYTAPVFQCRNGCASAVTVFTRTEQRTEIH